MNYFVSLQPVKEYNDMETIDQKLSYSRKRSIAAAIKDGYHLFLHHFAALLVRTWPLLLAYSLLLGFIGYFAFEKVSPSVQIAHTLPPIKDMWPLIAALVGHFVLVVLMIATTIKALQEHRATDKISSGRWYGSIGFRQVPLVFKVFWRCLRRFWHYIAIILVVMINTVLLTAVFECSAIYLGIAYDLANESTAEGNPAVLPENIGLITFGTFTFCGFFQALIHTSVLFPFYYAYKKR